MSFYNRSNASMGFVWLAPVVQLVGDAMKTKQFAPIQEEAPPSPVVPILLGLGGVALLGGLAYALLKSPSPRSRR